MRIIENIVLSATMPFRLEGPLKLDRGLFDTFLSLPEDPLPHFKGPTPELRGRGKDHPRYGRFMHAFVKYYKPQIVLEVGTNSGGTAVGTARALAGNGSGRLICVDNGQGRPRCFPDIARSNIAACGLEQSRFELICGDSAVELPKLSQHLRGKVGVCLVDAAHTYEAALADMDNALPMISPGGYMLVHDVAKDLDLGDEAAADHPYPVHEAFRDIARKHGLEWCVLKFIRKHLGVLRQK